MILQILYTTHKPPNTQNKISQQHKRIKRPYRAFDFCGGDEGIRTLDTVARIPHFQCGALDQLCDVSCVFFYSSTSSAVSTATSAVSTGTSSDANDASNSASISRNNGSSLPISSDSSPDIATGVSLYD